MKGNGGKNSWSIVVELFGITIDSFTFNEFNFPCYGLLLGC